jgi:hypothetical protein
MTFEMAVAGTDRPEMLTFLWVLGCPWDSGVCERAAANGFVRSLRWALENGFPLGGSVPYAAQEGQLEGYVVWGIGSRRAAWPPRHARMAYRRWLPVRDGELSGTEAEIVSEIMAAAASVAAQAAAAPAAAAEDADAALAVASGVA